MAEDLFSPVPEEEGGLSDSEDIFSTVTAEPPSIAERLGQTKPGVDPFFTAGEFGFVKKGLEALGIDDAEDMLETGVPAGFELAATLGMIAIPEPTSTVAGIGLAFARWLLPAFAAGAGRIATDIALQREIDENAAGIELLLSLAPGVATDLTPGIRQVISKQAPLSSGEAFKLMNRAVEQSVNNPGRRIISRGFDILDSSSQKVRIAPNSAFDSVNKLLQSRPQVANAALRELDVLEKKLNIGSGRGPGPIQQLFTNLSARPPRFAADTKLTDVRAVSLALRDRIDQMHQGSAVRDALQSFKNALDQSLEKALESKSLGVTGSLLKKLRELYSREKAADALKDMILREDVISLDRFKSVRGIPDARMTIRFGDVIKRIKIEQSRMIENLPALNPQAREFALQMSKTGKGMKAFDEFASKMLGLPDPNVLKLNNVSGLFGVGFLTGNISAPAFAIGRALGSVLSSDQGARVMVKALSQEGGKEIGLPMLRLMINTVRREEAEIGDLFNETPAAIDTDAVKDFMSEGR